MERNIKNHVDLYPKETKPLDSDTLLKRRDCNIQYGAIAEDKVDFVSNCDSRGKCMLFLRYLKTLTIEPIVFCYMFGYGMNWGILPNLMIDMGCQTHFNYSSEVCANLSGHPTEKENVEILASNFGMYVNIMAILGAFCMMFIAPWSDKYSRKLPLFLVVTGFMLMYIGINLCVFLNARLEYLILARIPAEIFGGYICAITIFYSYASEVSSEENRTLKCMCVEVSFGLGLAFGGVAAGYLYQYYGYYVVYITAASLNAFCLFWNIIVLKETAGLNMRVKWSKKLKDFFVTENIVKAFTAAFRKREGSKRLLIFMLVMTMCVIVVTYESFTTINYLFVHHIYNWDPATYNDVKTATMLIQETTSLIVVPIFIKIFSTTDFTLGVIGVSSLLIKNIIIAFSKYHVAIYYIGQFSGLFSSISSMVIRSSMSKLVEKDELGRIFSFMATFEIIIPMIGTVVFTQIFNATIDVVPSVVFCIAVVILLIPLFTFIWASKAARNTYSPLITTQSKDLTKEHP